MKKRALLPERHPNNDFFIADIFDALPVKDNRYTMEHPFFSLSTKKSIESVKYEHNGVEVKLSPSAEFGLPTMMDKDILLYCGSLVMAEVNKVKKRIESEVTEAAQKEREKLVSEGNLSPDYIDDHIEVFKVEHAQNLMSSNVVPKTLRLSCHDLMVTTNRMTNGQAYQGLKNAFERLAGCLITTNIKTNEIEEDRGFHLIESYKVLKGSHDNKRMTRVEVTLSDWYYNSLVGGEVLTINRDYFRLRKPLERRLYELARKFCGYQSEWVIGLVALQKKCGSRSNLNYFRFQINQIIKDMEEKSHFPDYLIELDEDDKVWFKNCRIHSQKLSICDLAGIKPETILRGKELVEQSNSGWDYNNIREQFTIQLQTGFRPESIDGAFINFVKKKISKPA